MTHRVLLSLPLAAALAAAPTAPAPAAAASAHACAKPAKLRFDRRTGRATGVLHWRGPRGARAFRVLRNGRVVGQTRRHALRIAVRLGRRYRFTVVPLGRGAQCPASRLLRVHYRAPGAPRHLVLAGDERQMRLSWQRGARGDGRLAGFRLLRGTTPVGQTRHTSWTLGAAPNRAYRFTVVAIDTRGHASRPSNAVTAIFGHVAPSAPQGVQALTVSDSAVGVQWSPSSAHAGRIAGYRVLRNGAVVGQVSGTSAVIGNLAPSSDYRFSVVAVDSLGYASAPSGAVTARTADPVPTGGHAQAYLLASTDQSFQDFQAHYRQIGVLYPTYFDCTADVTLGGRDDPLVTRWAQARKVLVLPRINCQETARVDRILTDPATRRQWLDGLTQLVADHGYDGLSIDFEAGPASDRDALSSFVADLAGRLHAAGKLLTIAVSPKTRDSLTHPRSGIFDYARLSQSADWVLVMVWGLHWSTSVPGAQDDASWAKGVADYVATLPLRQKFVYGTNLYAMDWPNGGGPSNAATAYQYGEIVPRLPQLGATTQLDPASDNYHATYTGADGAAHDVWYPDASTTGRRLQLAAADGFGGIALWRLGLEDQRLWNDPLLAPGAAW
ncbi:MAG TPA: glycosyl hydrolase family 18 protein [Conexibacter sp.]|nr:glycosyl hydrolase family 18 protein [Conexibacter sp.]